MKLDRAPRLNRAERQRRIENAATELFARRGYTATTVDEIARAAGVTKPMLYRHFESKQELCIALLQRYRDELVAAPLSAFDPGVGDRHHAMAAMIAAWLDHVHEHPDAARLLFIPITGDPTAARVQGELHELQRATQAALLREFGGELDSAESEPMAEVARASLAALGLWWLDHPEVPREVLVRVLVRAVEGMLTAHKTVLPELMDSGTDA